MVLQATGHGSPETAPLPLVLACLLGHLYNAMCTPLTKALSNFGPLIPCAQDLATVGYGYVCTLRTSAFDEPPKKQNIAPSSCNLQFCIICSTAIALNMMSQIYCQWIRTSKDFNTAHVTYHLEHGMGVV